MIALTGIPVIDTPRLRLRGPALRDLPASARFWASDRSHMMGGLAEADALAVIPAATTQVRAGDLLTCLPLPGGWWG